jgi:hypothetical protein
VSESKVTPFGYCECGCGGLAPISRWSNKTLGYVKGQPRRFILAHSGYLQRHEGPKHEVRDCGYETPCWVWVMATDSNGYGRLGGGALAHIAEWEKTNGRVPKGLELDHLCSNPPCVNPAHLEPVTHAENMRRGRGAKLTKEAVLEIRASNESRSVLAARFDVSRDTIRNVRHYRTWKNIA